MPALSNPKWELFAQELAKGKTADEAYALAGYKPNRGNAATLKANQSILNRVQEIVDRAAVRAEVSVARVLSELAKIGFSDIRKAIKWGEGLAVFDEAGNAQIANGVALIGSEQVDDDTAAAIAEVSQTKDGLKLKLHDKRGALVDIGRHLGMFKDNLQVSGPGGGPVQTVALTEDRFKVLAKEIVDDV